MKGKYVIAGVLVASALSASTLLAYPGRVSPLKAEKLARHFVLERLRLSNGAILTSGSIHRVLLFPIFDQAELLASGVLSESVGLAMRYAVLANDRVLFDQQFEFARKKMTGRYGLFFWKMSHDGETASPASASLDDLRIVHASLDAARLWREPRYAAFARDIADNIWQHEVVEGALRDALSWREYGEAETATTLQLSYIDIPALQALVAMDAETWQPVLTRTGDLLLAGQRDNGLFYEQFDFETNRYTGERQNMINQLYCAIFAVPLEKNGHPFHEWLRQTVKDDGALYAAYDVSTGMAAGTFESTSVYALAARYATLVGDRELAGRMLDKLLRFQNLNPLSPLYGGFCDDEVYSFDNLEALISLRLHNAAQQG